MDNKDLSQRFAHFVAALFQAEGFQVELEPKGSATAAIPDLLIRSQTGATAVVEMKLYRSRAMPVSALNQAAIFIEFSRRAFRANRSIIVTCSKVTPLARAALGPQFPDLVIYDVDSLAFLILRHGALVDTFMAITREAWAFSEIMELHPAEVNIEADISRPSMSPSPPPMIERETKGSDFCKEIHAIPTGRVHAKEFEEKVMEALRYIFDKDLTAWSPQKASDTKLSFYDLVVRVASDHDFWNAIVSQFRSRYIVFEFKNYGTKIKQSQIYTTEKYLFRTALRSTGIIISRNGADKNALSAARGALRESGKLIVNLDTRDLCDMLHLKDKGDDHNRVLVERVDDMLMRLEP